MNDIASLNQAVERFFENVSPNELGAAIAAAFVPDEESIILSDEVKL